MTWKNNDRRAGPRYAFVAAIEVVEPRSGKEVVSLTSDLSRHGCHVSTNTPFPDGTAVTLKIRRESHTVDATGRVAYAVPGEAMGIAFGEVNAAASVILESWLPGAQRLEVGGVLASDRRFILAVCIVIVAGLTAGVLAWLGLW